MALTGSVKVLLYLHFGKDYFSYNKENDEEEWWSEQELVQESSYEAIVLVQGGNKGAGLEVVVEMERQEEIWEILRIEVDRTFPDDKLD